MALDPSGTPSRAGIQQAIEDAILKRVKQGSVGGSSIPSGSVWTNVATVTFGVPFDTTPGVLVDITTAFSGADTVDVRPTSVTTTGFEIEAKCASAKGAGTYRWIAVANS